MSCSPNQRKSTTTPNQQTKKRTDFVEVLEEDTPRLLKVLLEIDEEGEGFTQAGLEATAEHRVPVPQVC